MSDTIKMRGPEGGPSPIFNNLYTRLQTLQGAKAVYCEVIDSYAKSEINESNARTLGYLLAGLLAYFRHEADVRIEERLDAIEQALEANR